MTFAVAYNPLGQNVGSNTFSKLHSSPPKNNSPSMNDASNASNKQKKDKATGIIPAGAGSASESTRLPERISNKYYLKVNVTGVERLGSLTNRKESPIIVFDVSTNLPTFRKPFHKNLRKSYGEFHQLFKYMNSAIPETFVPALPPYSTSFGINNEEDRQKMIQNFRKWMDRISNDPLIIRSDELAFFMESDFDTYTPLQKPKHTISGLRRKTLKQLMPPYDEVIELAEFRPLVKSIHLLSKDTQAKLLKMCRTRKHLYHEENSFGQAFCNLSVEAHPHNKLYNRFGRVLTAVGDIDGIIATFDMATLYDGLEWIVRDAYVIKEALTNRHFLMKELLHAQQTAKQRQENIRKLRSKRHISPLKVDDAIRELKLATKTEQDLTNRLHRVTSNMLIQKKNWHAYFVDFIISLVKDYALFKIEYERKKLSLLERVRSDVRNADTEGGLSRLGRDIASRSPFIHPSQSSEDGDAWTADTRPTHSMFNNDLDPQLFRFIDLEFDERPNSELLNSENLLINPDPLDARHAASILGTSTF